MLQSTILPDCGAPASDPFDEGCCQYAGHPGGHSDELTDPWRPRPRADSNLSPR